MLESSMEFRRVHLRYYLPLHLPSLYPSSELNSRGRSYMSTWNLYFLLYSFFVSVAPCTLEIGAILRESEFTVKGVLVQLCLTPIKSFYVAISRTYWIPNQWVVSFDVLLCVSGHVPAKKIQAFQIFGGKMCIVPFIINFILSLYNILVQAIYIGTL
jgi:hypothetical protein